MSSTISDDAFDISQNKINHFIIYEYKLKDIPSPKIKYYELNSDNIEYTNDLHDNEKHIIDYMLEEFKNLDDYESYQKTLLNEYPNNTIIISFYERKDNKIDDIHSILFWKKTKDILMYFEPNKTNFSEHFIKLFEDYTKIELDKPTYNNNTIYKFDKAKNTIMQKSRDCIDLCLKMALEINEIQLKKQINYDQMSSIIVDKFTNNLKNIINDKYKKAYIQFDGSSRIEQYSTNRENRNFFNEFILEYGQRGDDLKKSNDSLIVIKEIYKEITKCEQLINSKSNMKNQFKLIQNIK
jgi:hypothetical protein